MKLLLICFINRFWIIILRVLNIHNHWFSQPWGTPGTATVDGCKVTMWTVNLAFHWSQYNLLWFVLTSIKETGFGLSHVFNCIFILCTCLVDFLLARNDCSFNIDHCVAFDSRNSLKILVYMIDKTQANMFLDRRLTAAKNRIRCCHRRLRQGSDKGWLTY